MVKRQKEGIDKLADKFISHLRQHAHAKREDEEEIWLRIVDEVEKEETRSHIRKRMRHIYMAVSAVAACAIFLLYMNLGKDEVWMDGSNDLENYVNHLSEVINPTNGQVKLLLSGDRTVHIDKDSVGIVYASNGDIRINKDDAGVGKKEVDKNEFNQIIVPKGKYTRLTLADGTQMHVNSGTRVVYPRVFTGNLREIYVEGEVYLDVVPDKKKPFRVKTSQFEVEVLGTSFNVNAYKQQSRGEVVLVEGAVKLRDKQNNQVLLKPDNLVAVNDGQAGAIRRINAKDYTAWIDGLLILHEEPLNALFEKLNRFYDIPIVVAPVIQTEIVDGKLDLHLPLADLIRMISGVIPIDYQFNNGIYYISPKKK